MKKIFLILCLCAFSLTAAAQKETGLFFGAGAGMNFGFDGQSFIDRATSHNGAGWATDVYAGIWMTPTVGFRAGWQGLSISDRYTDFGNRKYSYIHGDVLFRLHRNFVPYVHGGYLHLVNNAFGGGAGIMLPLQVGKHVSIVPDIKANFYSGSAFGATESRLATTLSATVGIAFRFGFRKKATAAAPLTPALQVVHDTVYVNRIVRETETVVVRDTVYLQAQPLEPERISALALFDTNKVDLRPEALPELDRIAAWFAAHPDAKADIEGHTDNTASASYNQALSDRRALTVFVYLVSKGVDASRLSYTGYGQTRPVATNDTEEGRQQNRRVEIRVR